MWILQLSDIHLAPGERHEIDPDLLLSRMGEKIREFCQKSDKLITVVCGDIVYKGNLSAYNLARCFLEKMKEIVNCDIMFSPCPGNHDITSDPRNWFNGFNKFAWDLTSNAVINFSSQKTAVRQTIEDIDFILINSANHGDYTYGFVNIKDLIKVLKESESASKIIIIHHNLIPMDPKERSTIVNAYELLQIALEYDAKAILHGHRHMENIILVGENRCRLIGVGSLFFPPRYNLNNQFNLLKYEDSIIKEAYVFRYIADLHESGRIGGFRVDRIKEI